jgi:hypothetical protein
MNNAARTKKEGAYGPNSHIKQHGIRHGGFSPNPPVTSEPLMTIDGVAVLVDGTLFAPHTDGKSTHPGIGLTSRPLVHSERERNSYRWRRNFPGESINGGGFVEVG